MSDEKTFYITTPIYYVNDVPHVGNASTTIVSDVMARFMRLKGRKVIFATGTDENGPKVLEAARERGKDPQTFTDEIAAQFKDIWGKLNISYDDFIRTTEERHIRVVQEFLSRLIASGDVYKGTYAGWYCLSDETFFAASEVTDNLCPNPECRKPLKWVEEENYFFRLSRYTDRLKRHIEENPEFLTPEVRRNEVLRFIEGGLRDASISRSGYGWGIPVREDPQQVVYVWFDALLNYLTVTGWPEDAEKYNQTWPPDVEFMAKDIFVRFHSTLWPAMLMALDLPLPKRLFGHGFWTIEGEKISKSKGNAVPPATLARQLADISGAEVDVCVDAIRYFVMRELPVSSDSDFSMQGLIRRFNADLANDLGNLLNRNLQMLTRYFEGVVPQQSPPDSEIRDLAAQICCEVEEAFESLQFPQALAALWRFIARMNKYADEKAPWVLAREGKIEDLANVLYTALESVRIAAVGVAPFMPTVAKIIWHQLGIEEALSGQVWDRAAVWGGLKAGTRVRDVAPIFPRITAKETPRKEETPAVNEPAGETPYISFDEFKKLDLRTGQIKSAEKVAGADKLLKLSVDIGSEVRTVVAGIAQYYAPDALIDKTVVLIVNLAPAKIRGVESQGMLLAADVGGEAILLMPDRDVPPGSKVR
ncbi:MAG: methionine--tRNA ligase [Armatimonadetes bacterium]|nr:methionine--tRNA ligase [Armatimonadota bacterium]